MDSGAVECVFPANTIDLNLPKSLQLVAANGSSIKTFGKWALPVNFGGIRFVHQFWIAAITQPILGADFFTANGILIDMGNRCLVSREGHIFEAQPTSRPPAICGLQLTTSGPFEAVLEEFPDLLVQNFRGSVKRKVK